MVVRYHPQAPYGSVVQMDKTPPCHGGVMGSIPVGIAKCRCKSTVDGLLWEQVAGGSSPLTCTKQSSARLWICVPCRAIYSHVVQLIELSTVNRVVASLNLAVGAKRGISLIGKILALHARVSGSSPLSSTISTKQDKE